MPYVEIPAGPERLRGFLAEPDSPGPHPALIVCHEIFGLNAHFEDLCARFAAEGYVALCVDLYSREGAPGTSDLDVLRPLVAKIPDARIIEDLKAGVAFLRPRPNVRGDAVGAIGYCIGGAWAFLLASAERAVKAVSVYYGRIRYPELSAEKPRHPLDHAAANKAPVLGFFAKEDAFIPLSDVADFEAACPAGSEVHVVDAPHGFFNDTRECYRAAAAKDAWAKTMVFFARTLKA